MISTVLRNAKLTAHGKAFELFNLADRKEGLSWSNFLVHSARLPVMKLPRSRGQSNAYSIPPY